jgi:hypothetical protein
MKRTLLLLGFMTVAALGNPGRAFAQLVGMPVWNSPKGGTGLTLAGDFGAPDSVGGKGSIYAGRVVLGLSALTLSATVGVRNPEGAGANVTEYGGTAALRLIGGSLIPVSVNLQGGGARFRQSGINTTRGTVALGFAIDLPTPGFSIEPWVAPGLRVIHSGASASGLITSQTNTQFGVAGGLTLGFGMLGLHAALDYENVAGGGHTTTLGIGAHLAFRPSFGL